MTILIIPLSLHLQYVLYLFDNANGLWEALHVLISDFNLFIIGNNAISIGETVSGLYYFS